MARDESGDCLAALPNHMPYASSDLHMEAEALHAGLLIAIHQGWYAVDVESDCTCCSSSITLERDGGLQRD